MRAQIAARTDSQPPPQPQAHNHASFTGYISESLDRARMVKQIDTALLSSAQARAVCHQLAAPPPTPVPAPGPLDYSAAKQIMRFRSARLPLPLGLADPTSGQGAGPPPVVRSDPRAPLLAPTAAGYHSLEPRGPHPSPNMAQGYMPSHSGHSAATSASAATAVYRPHGGGPDAAVVPPSAMQATSQRATLLDHAFQPPIPPVGEYSLTQRLLNTVPQNQAPFSRGVATAVRTLRAIDGRDVSNGVTWPGGLNNVPVAGLTHSSASDSATPPVASVSERTGAGSVEPTLSGLSHSGPLPVAKRARSHAGILPARRMASSSPVLGLQNGRGEDIASQATYLDWRRVIVEFIGTLQLG